MVSLWLNKIVHPEKCMKCAIVQKTLHVIQSPIYNRESEKNYSRIIKQIETMNNSTDEKYT